MEFTEDRPIYMQIMDQIIQQIISGQMKPGDKVPSVRELALAVQTNPNTVQRALQELERENILYSERGKGRFVTKNEWVIESLNQNKLNEVMSEYLEKMASIGFDGPQAVAKLQEYLEEKVK